MVGFLSWDSRNLLSYRFLSDAMENHELLTRCEAVEVKGALRQSCPSFPFFSTLLAFLAFLSFLLDLSLHAAGKNVHQCIFTFYGAFAPLWSIVFQTGKQH